MRKKSKEIVNGPLGVPIVEEDGNITDDLLM